MALADTLSSETRASWAPNRLGPVALVLVAATRASAGVKPSIVSQRISRIVELP